MPARYDYTTSSYRLTCTRCSATANTPSVYNADAVDPNTGRPVSETFRFHSSRHTFLSQCRACERQARQRRSRNFRVPGTTRGAMGIARPFGVEFECAFPANTTDEQIVAALQAEGLDASTYYNRRRGQWFVKGDVSISVPRMRGREIVSPPLSGEEGEEQVRKAARALRSLGAQVNKTCGTHVHHDANDLTVDEIKRTARGWFNNQNLIDGLVSPSRRRGGDTIYTRPLTDGEVEMVERATNLEAIKRIAIQRYRTMNLTSYGKHGTIEIRQHQGTLDAEKVISWIRLGQAIIDTAKTSAVATPTHSRMRDLLTALGDNLNETARTFLLGRAVEFNAVAV